MNKWLKENDRVTSAFSPILPPTTNPSENPCHHLQKRIETQPWATTSALPPLGQQPRPLTWASRPASSLLSRPPCLAPLWPALCVEAEGAVKTEGRARAPLLPPSRPAHCIQELLLNTSCCLGISRTLLCSHIDMPAPSPPQGLCPCSISLA